MGDDYASLGPEMRQRLDQAELLEVKVNNWLLLLAERDRAANLIAREICVVAGLERLKVSIENTTWPWER